MGYVVFVCTGKTMTKCTGDYAVSMASSSVTSLHVLQASRLAAAAAAAVARQHAFYSRVLGMSRPAGDDHHALRQAAARCTSTDPVNSGPFRSVSTRFHPYD